MLSIKDFARDFGVSYEAVRKQIKRYEAELQGHIHMQGRTQYLDDVAVAFLSEHRSKPVMAVYDGETDRKIQALELREKELLEEKAVLAAKVAELSEWKADMAVAIAAAEQTRLALAASEEAQKALEAQIGVLTAENAAEREKTAQAQKEAQEASELAQKTAEEFAAYKGLPFYKKFRRG